MKEIVWSDRYSVGIDAVDLQHEYFAGLINRVGREMIDRQSDRQHVQRLVDEI